MKKILQVNGAEIGCAYTTFVEARRIAPDQISVVVTSTFEKARDPNEERKVTELFLNNESLNTLLEVLNGVKNDNCSTTEEATTI